jgi:hypothetical protein
MSKLTQEDLTRFQALRAHVRANLAGVKSSTFKAVANFFRLEALLDEADAMHRELERIAAQTERSGPPAEVENSPNASVEKKTVAFTATDDELRTFAAELDRAGYETDPRAAYLTRTTQTIVVYPRMREYGYYRVYGRALADGYYAVAGDLNEALASLGLPATV